VWYDIIPFIILCSILLIVSKGNRIIILLGLLGYSIGFWIGQSALQEKYNTLESLNTLHIYNTKITVSGVIDRDVYRKERSIVYRLYIDTIDT
jgi:uncharacterized membrane protein YiaA